MQDAERDERATNPGLIRVGTVVEQVRPIARSLLGDVDPTDLGVRELRGDRAPTHPGEPAEVYFVLASTGERTLEFVWKRALEGDCLERLALEREVYRLVCDRTRRVPHLLAIMEDSDEGGGLAIEYLPQLALDLYDGGEPTVTQIGKIAAALAEFARDVPVTDVKENLRRRRLGEARRARARGVRPPAPTIQPSPLAGSYVERLLVGLRAVPRRTELWRFVLEVFEADGKVLDGLPTVMSPGYSAPNIGFREGDPLPVFYDLDTVHARPIGSGLVTGLALRPDFDDLVPVIQASLPVLTTEHVYFLALGRFLELWAAGDPRGRPGACRCLDLLGVAISEEIRTS